MRMANSRTADEETPLLQKKKLSSIPWTQISLLLILQLAEPLTSQVIYPFSPEFVRNVGITHGDENKVGYYVGLMQSIFFATQALTVLHWSRISDVVGRKPVILTGLFGLSLSMYCFGLSRTYWGAVISRSLNGALNGNIGVMKSMLAEITEPENLAKVYGYMPIAWSTGGTLGPIIGGCLSRPADRFPDIFGGSQFMDRYPYFLACAVPATFSAIAWLITFAFLRETVRSPISVGKLLRSGKNKDDLSSDNLSSEDQSITSTAETTVDEREKPVPLHSLFTSRVLIAAGNYATLSIVDIAYRAVQPLFFSTPINMGGLGFPPPVIGWVLSVFGVLNGIFQVFFFARIHDRWGTRNVFIAGLVSAVPCFALFPVMNVLAKAEGVSRAVWFTIGLQIVLSLGLSLCYGCVFIYIAASAPNRASLGATNGLAQMMVSVMRTVGPAAANSLFSLSIEHNYLNGFMVYWVLLGTTLAALAVSSTLPRKVW